MIRGPISRELILYLHVTIKGSKSQPILDFDVLVFLFLQWSRHH